MLKKDLKKYVLLGATLFFLIILPPFFVEAFRGKIVGVFAPFWKSKEVVKRPFLTKKSLVEIECKKLEGENQLLKSEVVRYKLLLEQLGIYEPPQNSTKFFKKSILATVIYRDPQSWGSSFWINVGEETNRICNSHIIAKNSPVLFGQGVVGVIDLVQKKQSRVRLITDSLLKISVRASRNISQNSPSKETAFLAKGVLQGTSSPLWRKNLTLKGIGFNYDFKDAVGCARDLVTGIPEDSSSAALPLVQVNDLLITTGMDGVFPAHLPVAKVAKVYPLKEGSYAYNIEAVPFIQNMDELKTVFIIPPIGFNGNQK